MRKPKVGETLYCLNVGNAARRLPQVLSPVTVTKVGRKYFTVGEGFRAIQFRLLDWSQNTEYSVGAVLYESEQEWEDEKECAALCDEIGKAFKYGRNRKALPLDVVRKVHGLVTENTKRVEHKP